MAKPRTDLLCDASTYRKANGKSCAVRILSVDPACTLRKLRLHATASSGLVNAPRWWGHANTRAWCAACGLQCAMINLYRSKFSVLERTNCCQAISAILILSTVGDHGIQKRSRYARLSDDYRSRAASGSLQVDGVPCAAKQSADPARDRGSGA